MEQLIKRPKDHRIRYSYEWALVNPGVMHLRLPKEIAKAYIHVNDKGGYTGYFGFWSTTSNWFPTLEEAMKWCEESVVYDVEVERDKNKINEEREQEMVDWFK